MVGVIVRDKQVVEFLESGGEDELTLAWNRDIFRSFRFVPRTLVNTSMCDIGTSYCGSEYKSPLIVGPSGHNNIMRSNGDVHRQGSHGCRPAYRQLESVVDG